MAIQLTREQQAAVSDRGGSLLVSAAAGSGKTKVLVQRLLDRCLGDEGCDIDQFLIITYTRAAAAELRGRIAQELNERLADAPDDRRLRRQLLRVYRADIKTIDAFCTALVRENIHLLPGQDGLSLSQDFRVLDDSEAALLRQRVLPRVLEEFYEELTPGGALLADGFGFGRDDRSLEELVLDLYGKLQSHAYPEAWLAEQMALWRDPSSGGGDGPYGRLLRGGLTRKARHWMAVLEDSREEMRCDGALERAYGGAFAQGAACLRTLAEAAETGWDQVGGAVPAWPRLNAARNCAVPELKAMLQSRWARCKREIAAALAPFTVTGVQAEEDMARVAPAMEALGDLCLAFSRAYGREKLRRNAADFSDQEHYAVALLIGPDGQPTEVARTVADRYREVMVDEYQDTNQVQNAIFDALSGGGRRLFAVGDVKQSIYRFRLADPTIFLEKYGTFPDYTEAAEGEPRRILLSRNFRSRQPVLDAVNFVFQAVMSRDMGEMDYGADEKLNFGADYLPPREGCQTEFHLIHVPSGGRALTEARFVAQRVRRLLDEGFPVTDETTGALRPCRESDIVVLLRSPGPRLRWYAQAMGEAGVPCSTGESEDFFSAMEVAVTYSLLQILDNPRQDVPLIAVLRSPVFGFTPDRLAVIRGNHPSGDFYDALAASEDQDCRDFLALLDALRLESKDMSVYRLIWRLYDQLHMLAVFGAMSGGDRRRENLVAFSQHAQSFEAAGYKGLFAFVSHLRFLLENGRQPETAAGSNGEGVRIMSIHRSKGLEFPIVILADLSKEFNRQDLQTPVLVHPRLGLGPMFIDLDRRLKYPTLARRAVESAMSREARSEEMRVLYVGMTRAKEKLILVASMKNTAKRLGDLTALSALPVPPETVDGARSAAEWVMLPLLRRREAAPLRAMAGMEEGLFDPMEDTPWIVALHEEEQSSGLREAEEERQAPPPPEPPVDREALEFRYPYQAECLLPSKLTATQLKGRLADSEIAEHTAPVYVPSDFSRPRFLEGEAPLTPSQRGTATHLVMQYLPLDGDPADTVADLVERRLLTRQQGAAVDLTAIRRFLASPLAEELRRADSVQREYRFSILVPASEYFPQAAAGEELLLQGVVDLFAQTPEGVTVVDFKTDYVTAETLAEKTAYYRPQLTAYSAALARILDRPVVRRVLYFFRTGDAVEV